MTAPVIYALFPGTAREALEFYRDGGDFDGQVVDRYGLRWLIGFKG